MIPYSRQKISNKDIQSVSKVLNSKILARGPQIEIFEKKISKIVKSKFGLAVNSATSGLHLACLSLDLKKNDLVWTVPNSFIASANCARYCGAKVDFVDINPENFNIDIELLEKKLKYAKKIKKLPKILITVHFAGLPTEQDKISKLSKKFKFSIIEDASHSLGASYKKEPVGSCKWSDIVVFSFHPVKTITTGEGGMVMTNNKEIYSKLVNLRNHGIEKNINKLKRKIKSKWYYEQQDLGFNYWMSDIQAALGISQLTKLKKFVKKRNEIAKFYKKNFRNFPIRVQKIGNERISSYHLFVISIDLKKIKNTYDQVFKKLVKNGLSINLHYLPIHLHPYYKNLGFRKGQFPVAEKYSETSLSIPIFYDLTVKERIKVVKIIKKVLKI